MRENGRKIFFQLLWNLTGVSADKFQSDTSILTPDPISRLRDFERSYDKTSYAKLNLPLVIILAH